MKYRFLFTVGAGLIMLSVTGCSNNKSNANSSSKSEIIKKNSNVKKKKAPKPSANAKNRTWTYKNNVFDAGIETYTFTKSEIMDSQTPGKKLLVLYCNVRNNSNKEQDPSNVYMVVHAYQKTKTSDVKLNPGIAKLDNNGNDPLQKYSDNLNNKLLPGKTVKACLAYDLKNTNPVKITFENSNFETIGTKTVNINKEAN